MVNGSTTLDICQHLAGTTKIASQGSTRTEAVQRSAIAWYVWVCRFNDSERFMLSSLIVRPLHAFRPLVYSATRAPVAIRTRQAIRLLLAKPGGHAPQGILVRDPGPQQRTVSVATANLERIRTGQLLPVKSAGTFFYLAVHAFAAE